MGAGIRALLFQQILLLSCISYFACFATGSDTIFSGQYLFQNQTIISKEGIFVLGFFSPGNLFNWYVGIWYKNISFPTVVWVANRDNPISRLNSVNSFLELRNGNLHLFNNVGEQFGQQVLVQVRQRQLQMLLRQYF
ncbi:hypothetical protein ACH5RR_017742 [Cinchona calisaya]|uniref:Bulb-type lectin domain-containing protein n=1 Tax=Cinchona calisaya TaxID=153742 RepID=A0ABD2ZKR9_9GENT